MNFPKALVILSGGQDSTTCLVQAVQERGVANVAAITFHYGQRHQDEVEVARSVVADFGIASHLTLDLEWYGRLATSALTSRDEAIARPAGAAAPNTMVDGRNMLFLTLAAIHAKSLGIRDIICGVGQTDFSGYPDCRDVFVKSCNVTLNLAMDYEFRLITPLMDLTKAQVWELADTLGVMEYIEERTLTCYNGIMGRGCGECPACVLRNRGYDDYMERKSC